MWKMPPTPFNLICCKQSKAINSCSSQSKCWTSSILQCMTVYMYVTLCLAATLAVRAVAVKLW